MNHKEILRRIFITSKSRHSFEKWELLIALYVSKMFKQLQMNMLLQNTESGEVRMSTSQRETHFQLLWILVSYEIWSRGSWARASSLLAAENLRWAGNLELWTKGMDTSKSFFFHVSSVSGVRNFLVSPSFLSAFLGMCVYMQDVFRTTYSCTHPEKSYAFVNKTT